MSHTTLESPTYHDIVEFTLFAHIDIEICQLRIARVFVVDNGDPAAIGTDIGVLLFMIVDKLFGGTLDCSTIW